MKLFKRISLFMVLCLSLVGLTGCGSKNVEGSLEDIMTKLYQDIPQDERPMLANTKVNEENIEYYLGIKDIKYTEALASEPMMSSIAHSVVLVRVEDNANIEEVKTAIKENVDPRKWLCVGVEKEDLIVKNKGNLVVLIMVEDEATRNKLEEGFNNL